MNGTAALLERLASVVGADGVLSGDGVPSELTHDEGLSSAPRSPVAVVLPSTTAQVVEIVAVARELGAPITARGSGTGLSGGCVPSPGGFVVSFSRMNRILEIDDANHVAVVQPGVTLAELEEAVEPRDLMYPVYPGEQSASLGGTVNTNAGGMRAVRYGVTRTNVLGLEMVLGTGELVRSGGKNVKSSTGYDLTQLVIGSEGTLGLVTEVTARLRPVLRHRATVLAPFASLGQLGAAVGPVLASGLDPAILEYIDTLAMSSITASGEFELGVSRDVAARTGAYLVVMLEQVSSSRVSEDVEELGRILSKAGAIDVFALPGRVAASLIAARERAFFLARAAGAHEVVDVVVPRGSLAVYLEAAGRLSARHGCLCVGCGHAGDGNVHLSVFQPDAAIREGFLVELFRAAMDLGGAISGEHGIGTAKQEAFLRLEDPSRIAVMRRIKAAFDPLGILNPDKVLGSDLGGARA